MNESEKGQFNPFLILTKVALNNCKQAIKLGELEVSNEWHNRARNYLQRAKIWDMTKDLSDQVNWND